MSTRPLIFLAMTLAHPSAICARLMRPACRCFQSEDCIHWGNTWAARGVIEFPPIDSASRSKHSWPKSYSSPSPSFSCVSVSALCQSESSCTRWETSLFQFQDGYSLILRWLHLSFRMNTFSLIPFQFHSSRSLKLGCGYQHYNIMHKMTKSEVGDSLSDCKPLRLGNSYCYFHGLALLLCLI